MAILGNLKFESKINESRGSFYKEHNAYVQMYVVQWATFEITLLRIEGVGCPEDHLILRLGERLDRCSVDVGNTSIYKLSRIKMGFPESAISLGRYGAILWNGRTASVF